MSYPNINSYQGSIAESDEDLKGAITCLLVVAGAFLSIGFFVGWLIFAPASFEPRPCGTVEQCTVRAEAL